MPQMKDRIKNFKRIQASKLIRNSQNWRIHPKSQETALRTLLQEIGFAAACLVRDCGNGTYEIIDGHLRADIAEEAQVPCLILDVTKPEADQLLATFDYITTLAETDQSTLNELVDSTNTESQDLRKLLDVLSRTPISLPENAEGEDETHLLVDSFSVLVECKNESEQKELLQRLTTEGFQCRAWIS